jgi:glycosyltransferase involved in cell wall biosynthesis
MGFYPKISIITPSFNQADYIEYTILSVLSQGYPNLEYIIIDGGSTDGSLDIIKKYADKLTYWVSEPDSGMYDAINKGFAKSSGEILAWINSDDVYFDNAFHTVADIFTQIPKVDWITGRCGYIDRTGNKTRTSKKKIYNRELLRNGFYRSPYSYVVNQNVVFWRKSLWEKVGGCDKNYRAAGDFVLWMKFSEHAKLYFFDFIFSAFRKHENQITTSLNSYKKEVESSVAISPFKILLIFLGKQYEGQEIIKNTGNNFSIVSINLNPRYLQPLKIIRSYILYLIKKLLTAEG